VEAALDMYIYIDLDNEYAIPQAIVCHWIDGSYWSYIETIFEVTVAFRNCNEPLDINGGYQIAHEFKKSTLDTLTTEDCQKIATSIARSFSTVLSPEYVDTNLPKAFPLQFLYGIGNLDLEENCRYGTSYLQYLLTSSSPNFHLAELIIIIHNMLEQKYMVASFFKVLDDQEGLYR